MGAEGDAGIGFYSQVFDFEASVGLSAQVDSSLGFLRSAQTETGRTKTISNSLDAGGTWEPLISTPGDAIEQRLKRIQDQVGRRYIILIFPIQPTYTKQGTLDGKVGFENDPDYPDADQARGSYFKPKEAYDLIAHIEAYEAGLEADYQNFDAGRQGRREAGDKFSDEDPVTSPAGSLKGTSDKAYEWEKQRSKRNIVNSYVWTAAGGLYAEQEQTVAVREESSGGNFEFKGELGTSLELEFEPGFSVEAGALAGSQIHTTVTKAKQEGRDFEIEVSVEGEGFLERYVEEIDGDGKVANWGFDGKSTPGKVTACRFKTFYLTPEKRYFNTFFEKVVDQKWLRNSQSPDAIALREAQARDNAVWRVMHRVTFVSRVPPDFEEGSEETIEKTTRSPIDIPGNQVFIEKVQAALKSEECPQDKPLPQQVGCAVAMVLDDLKSNPIWGAFYTNGQTQGTPEAGADQLRTLKQAVLWYMQAYEERQPLSNSSHS